ncbi:MAG: hypothetical protein ACT6S0_26710 [Roseateles sp.]|uniref:hypothetical protein n=1 Tax=Roseateles sp. TaxID=1971397 RepID=UPI0040359CC4
MGFYCGWLLAAVQWLIFRGAKANTAIAIRQQERCMHAATGFPHRLFGTPLSMGYAARRFLNLE